MTEKAVSKFLSNLQKNLADKNPVLMEAAKAYHEFDQFIYDQGWIDMDDTTASKISWWPLITMIGGPNSGKSGFIKQLLVIDPFVNESESSQSKFSVFYQSDNAQMVTLPGTALDGDPRFPFYRISEQIEHLKVGEGRNINNYLELKTCNSPTLKGKTIVCTPGFNVSSDAKINLFITENVVNRSDLVLVFFDAINPEKELSEQSLKQFFFDSADNQKTNRFIYIINQMGAVSGTVDPLLWKTKLAEYGIESNQFFVLNGIDDHATLKAIEQKIADVDVNSAYRIVNSLENSIHDLDKVVMEEVRKALHLWKDRVHFTITLILSILAFFLVIAEIQVGFVAVLYDPIIGPIALLALIAIMIPVHIFSSKQHAKLIIQSLNKRQKQLGLVENLAAIFAGNLTFWNMILPVKEPVGWDKQTRGKLTGLIERCKELIQSLNDNFSLITEYNASVETDLKSIDSLPGIAAVQKQTEILEKTDSLEQTKKKKENIWGKLSSF